jgi:hypothetical protein
MLIDSFAGISDDEVIRRDAEIEEGRVRPLSHVEFIRRVEETRR